ncbi:hypothetical protein O7626_05295 [Micromonospora sp. WMMD1102]|uniref:hypothetical protein n=1 Tax=Micromonospora sp. WMMD1102 TaxID=3016105 RepID=UPI0024158622|nr:hypothetical protein [Micromonospora sp. WMMD1102]MDG4785353.1 hypothetical protein [Micromonospora sp. WMMD1102]
MTYYLMIFGELHRDRLVSALATLFALPVEQVDVGDSDDVDRNWSAQVICTVAPVTGHLHWQLEIYPTDTIVPQPPESVVAVVLAQQLGTVVVYPGPEPLPSAYWLVAPDGRRTRARIVDDGGAEESVYRIEAVEHPVAVFPDLAVAALPEVIREHRMPTPVTDRLRAELKPWSDSDVPAVSQAVWQACTRLGAWEGMVARMAAGWPPDGWYPAAYYREDLELRDELAQLGQALPEQARTPFAIALGEVDQQFVARTEDDEGAALAAELGPAQDVPRRPDRWWWQRVSQPLPWRDQPARPAG